MDKECSAGLPLAVINGNSDPVPGFPSLPSSSSEDSNRNSDSADGLQSLPGSSNEDRTASILPYMHAYGIDAGSGSFSFPVHPRQPSPVLEVPAPTTSCPTIEVGESIFPIFSIDFVAKFDLNVASKASIVAFMHVDKCDAARDSPSKPLIIIPESIHVYGDLDEGLKQVGSAKITFHWQSGMIMQLYPIKLALLFMFFSHHL